MINIKVIDSNTSKTFKHLNIMLSTSPNPLGLSQSLEMDFFNLLNAWNVQVHVEGKPLHLWTSTGLAATWTSWLMTGNQFMVQEHWFMVILAGASLYEGCILMKTSFYGYWYWILDVGLISMMSAAGSPFLAGWCDALSHKLKIT